MELTDAQRELVRKSGVDMQDHANAFRITLGEQTFDPIDGVPAVPSSLAAGRSDGPDLHLIQMTGPTKAGWVDELEAAGLKVVQYIHPYTYVVWGDLNARDAFATKSNVRWTGDFAPGISFAASRPWSQWRPRRRACDDCSRCRSTCDRSADSRPRWQDRFNQRDQQHLRHHRRVD
ncbi:MAG: hypothetical protein R3E58_07070 [Phycisphaerae bacterium]